MGGAVSLLPVAVRRAVRTQNILPKISKHLYAPNGEMGL